MEDKFGNKIEDDAKKASEATKNQEEKKDFKDVKQTLGNFFYNLLDIRHDTDKKGTIEDIKGNISMQGHTAWILIFSIIIASIGLNANSTAVVIGAMLISPLMGPILGVGLSIGINDIDTLRKSLLNLGVMIGLSLLTSFLFFSIPLFQDLTPEIKARTAPDVRDVFIAIAGGLALIVALSRRSKQTNTIAGVAIATALMPPLCTAGYGLAVGKLSYFGGAMFLFTINTIFIALATFIIVKYLGFPMVRYINSAKRKRIAQLASFVAVIILGFSIYSFTQLIFKKRFTQNAKAYIELLKNKGVSFMNDIDDEKYLDFENKKITVFPYGKQSNKEIDEWKKLLSEKIPGATLDPRIDQDITNVIDKIEQLEKIQTESNSIIINKDKQISLKNQVIDGLKQKLEKYENNIIPFAQISQEAKINYEGLERLGYSNRVQSNFQTLDTVTVFSAKWYDSIPKKELKSIKLRTWLKTRLKLDTVYFVIEE